MEQPPNGSAGHAPRASHLSEGLCRGLLHGLLSPEDRRAALSHIADCPVCEELFRQRVVERERLRATFAVSAGVDGEVKVDCLRQPDMNAGADTHYAPVPSAGLQAEPGSPSASPVQERVRARGHRSGWGGLGARLRPLLQRPRYAAALGLAAAAIVLVTFLLPHRAAESDDVPRWLPVPEAELQLRGTGFASADGDLVTAFRAYAAHDAPRAAQLLQECTTAGQLELLRRICLGSALAINGQDSAAAAVLRTVRTRQLPDPWGAEAGWTLYLALRRSGDHAAADSLLGMLAAEGGEVGARARRVRGD